MAGSVNLSLIKLTLIFLVSLELVSSVTINLKKIHEMMTSNDDRQVLNAAKEETVEYIANVPKRSQNVFKQSQEIDSDYSRDDKSNSYSEETRDGSQEYHLDLNLITTEINEIQTSSYRSGY